MKNLAGFQKQRQRHKAAAGEDGRDAADTDGEGLPTADDLRPAGRYETPQITVIGSVRDLTTGSTSSGSKDANSQYYW
jgi:hypothetical protein